jgi:hypothetical protein
MIFITRNNEILSTVSIINVHHIIKFFSELNVHKSAIRKTQYPKVGTENQQAKYLGGCFVYTEKS